MSSPNSDISLSLISFSCAAHPINIVKDIIYHLLLTHRYNQKIYRTFCKLFCNAALQQQNRNEHRSRFSLSDPSAFSHADVQTPQPHDGQDTQPSFFNKAVPHSLQFFNSLAGISLPFSIVRPYVSVAIRLGSSPFAATNT